MVSPELLRRYPFFAGLSMEQITALAMASEELSVEAGHTFFKEGEQLDALYLVLEGKVDISIALPEQGSRAVGPALAEKAREVVLSSVGSSQLFAWSALVPPYQATSGATATSTARVVSIDCVELRRAFEGDPRFGYQMMVRVAQIVRDRLQDMHNESLAQALG